ncbi:HEPN domain-containing protein [Clostridium sp. Marseille-P2415]|uniref:HEPN domain-containing protein n=1 Tax=Clostridium sp. Marseille-P2415 TaxID=1805471 RepID=UPI0009888393|nr:HEPN domain-containing protein [Clostridium sp. Marseille-P2415]
MNEFNDFNSIVKHYGKKPIKEFDFIKVSYGMTIDSADFIEYRDITLIKKDFIEEFLNKNRLDNEIVSHFYNKLKTNDDVIYMKIKCSAKDEDKAQEYAIQRFKLIDTCFRFLLKNDNSDRLRIGFYNLNHESTSGMYGYNNNTFVSLSEIKSSVSIDKFVNYLFESDLSKRVWDLMEKQYLNDMETRVKEAIICISEATHQNDDGIAYMQCFLALEAILMEQDGFINKSITAQISEYVAFIIGKERNERISFEKEIKDLYTIRSSIAHGKNKKVISQELERIFIIVKIIIAKFLTDKKLMSIRNVKELRAHITDLKFK